MTIATLARSLLFDRLHDLVESPVAEEYLCITARRKHGARSVTIEQPTFAIVLSGSKQLHSAGATIDVPRGGIFVVTRPCQLDAVNNPDPETGLYLTLTVPLCDEVIAAARLLWPQPVVRNGDDVVAVEAQRLEAELLAWACAIQKRELGEARLALVSLLIRLCQWGHTAVLAPPPPSVAAQVRAIVAKKPDREWLSRHFEEALGVSGATLRRRLSAEKTTLGTTVTDARLARAMELLYTTRWPIKTIAARVGYRSPATFVRRFTERYGLEPAAIGNA